MEFSKISANLLFCLFLMLVACQPYEESTQRQTKGAMQDTLFRYTTAEDVNVMMFDQGKRFLNIKSNQAQSHQDKDNNYTRFSGNVFIQLFDSLNTVQSQVQCSTAVYDVTKQTFDLIGGVNVHSSTNRKLFTEKLTWFRIDKHIETDAFVSIFTEKDTLYGYGLISDEALENYQIKKVSGNITID